MPGMQPNDDWYIAAIDAIEVKADDAHAALNAVIELFSIARAARLEGRPLPDIVDGLYARGARELRRDVGAAFREYEDAVTAYRAVTIRALVDEGGMSFSDVAASVGVSRQMIAKLYRRGVVGGGS